VTSSDAPQPPGGPLREDEPEGPLEPTQSEEDAELQEENAGTSLDQPST
jgi:hypothetical protein